MYDAALEKAEHGPTWLADVRCAKIVADEIHALEPEHYQLHAFCIMSNHAHLLIDQQDIPEPPRPASGQHFSALSNALRLLKGHSARYCNLALGRAGKFWQDESYDHIVRSEKEFQRILFYLINNPVKAGLATDWQDWPHTFVNPNLL